MGSWSAENATNAYLRTIKMGSNDKEPNVAEFVSALSAGNNAQLMVVACATTAGSPTLGLVAAAHQTGGRVICIVRGEDELYSSIDTLGCNASRVEFVVGEPQTLLSGKYRNADLVVIDCNLENHEEIFRVVQISARRSKICTTVLGYNAFCKNSWQWGGSKTHLLPIGEGLLMTRIAAKEEVSGGLGKRSRWIVQVDKCTGEEHVFRVRMPHGRSTIKA
ncbi:Chaperonin 60 subunit beta 3, chloroplastic-like protein [Heracleum sosnowskyi]|uniref:Chaperonin 60 subunit beta 3, chloroplastic-like protein n=1 Tax=Heracleum sosnowskyi TaxID=360622 RepID=A0AAD8H4L9_9APIA|nr:Chaperonin 60 subunit beta 3, chloroplastic-like protein [Heracleum sosnowskyi]